MKNTPKGVSWAFLARNWQPFPGCQIPPVPGLDQEQVAHALPPGPAELQHLFDVIFSADLGNRDALVDTAKRGNRWWCLTEPATRLVRTKTGVDRQVGQLDVIYPAIYAIIVPRRTMSTVITTPGGVVRSPMDDMPPLNVETEVLKFGVCQRKVGRVITDSTS